jgi:hypothetical protein
MPLRYLLDEHLRGGGLWQAIIQHNAAGVDLIDAVRVGDPADLPLGTADPDVLHWAEREDRIVLTLDKRTMPGHLADHLRAGGHLPGLFVLRPHVGLPQLVFHLALIAHAGDPAHYRDHVEHVP